MALRILIAGIVLAFVGVTPSLAQAAIKRQLNIPQQALGSALAELARQAKIQVIYSTELVKGLESSRVEGSMTPEEAVRRMLPETGLKFEFVDENTITLVAAPQKSAGSAAGEKAAELSGGLHLARESRIHDSNAGAGASASGGQESNPASPGNRSDNKANEPEEIGEIVVTAQKREQRLIDTPISIGVLRGEDLDHSSARGIADVLTQVAGVSLLESRPGQTQIAVRGVISGSAGGSTVAYYIDETPFSFISQSQLPDAGVFDLARVEVLRGPQGTLYGASALNGVVRVLTNDADLNDYQVKGRMRGSDTARGSTNYGADAAVNLPLIPGKLAVRGVAGYTDLSGYVGSLADGQRHINYTRAQSYRLKVNYQPSDELSLKLNWSRSDIANGPTSGANDNFQSTARSTESDDRVYDIYNLVAEYDWPQVSLLSSTSYVAYDAATQFSFYNLTGIEALVEELRLTSNLEGSWQWSAGLYYKDQEDVIFQFAPAFGFPFPFDFRRQTDSYSVFGELTRSFADGRFKLTGGLRYFYDDHVTEDFSSLVTGTAGLPPPNLADFDKVTWRAVLTYQPQAERMFYASVSTGFRSGLDQSATTTLAAAPLVIPSLNPDTLINYEIGAKGELFDRLTYDMAVYYTGWDEIQQQLSLPNGFLVFANGGAASGVGVEGGLAWQATQAFNLYGNFSWNDLALDENVFSRGTILLFVKGDRANNSPEWTGAVGGSYRMPSPLPNHDLVLDTNFTYRSPLVQRAVAGTTITAGESETVTRLNASIGLEADRWSIQLYGDNLLNDSSRISTVSTLTGDGALRQRPRTVGLQATFNY